MRIKLYNQVYFLKTHAFLWHKYPEKQFNIERYIVFWVLLSSDSLSYELSICPSDILISPGKLNGGQGYVEKGRGGKKKGKAASWLFFRFTPYSPVWMLMVGKKNKKWRPLLHLNLKMYIRKAFKEKKVLNKISCQELHWSLQMELWLVMYLWL